ncbi:MAG: FtsX-like permease family protein [Candidatus Marinimicrobia bacterium]|jgi:putative ABC transport system permease protein|nr:FtsX-like permease family protein [Candidatus Neomarinimicrobiota bacterium]MBT3634495.1 FtsX-like permease family protein [Candidatus Neomarinimicrobiota bacterium]MBT3683392.1 FtsX-like permease family protein [Candidatus Neomarinimicrobiota bacterium]MBT3760280.1 FtsX-like permease family protein [Candidatus Neomarinimicrobiota bacterium]MBT3896375.1 FtsX-like permease family protein [Candidatus Neomarinimicrobiota bacterium]
MLLNNLKITLRNLMKYKGFSLINILGLALSISICLIMIIFIKDWKSSDQFHVNKERISRIYTTDTGISYSEIDGWANTPGSLVPILLDNYPSVQNAARLMKMSGNVLNTETAVSINGLYAEPAFLDIFSYPLKYGDPASALDKPYSIIISEEIANKFFAEENPINKELQLETLGNFTVTGVLMNQSERSHFIFETLASFATVQSLENRGIYNSDLNNWKSFSRYYTYILHNESANIDFINEKLSHTAELIFPESERDRLGFRIQPLLDINLGMNLINSMPGTKHAFELIILPVLAIVIIFLACFNYIILSIARALKRTKEIGLRKVIGANKRQIIRLFLSETFVITLLALAAACLMLFWLVPLINNVDAIENARMQINLEFLQDPGIYGYFIIFAIIVSLVAGLYPAIYLSSFLPVNALKGVSNIRGFSQLITRKVLMAIQFGVTIISIIFITYFYQLHSYWMNYDRGIIIENIVSIELFDVNPETIRNELMTNSNINGVSFSSDIPIYGGGNFTYLRKNSSEEPDIVANFTIDPNFIDDFELALLAGRNFSSEFVSDVNDAIIINEKAVLDFQLGTPIEAIGKNLVLGKDKTVTVIGVVRNYHFSSLENPIGPIVLNYDPVKFNYANIRFLPGGKEEIKLYLSKAWEKFDKLHPVNGVYFEDRQQEMDSMVSGILQISAGACGFVIIIALLGLLGMATYSTELKIKEIGIRKVLGASVTNVTYMLSKGYVKLILITAIVALPGAYFISDGIFQFFAVRPDQELWVLPVVLIFIMGLSILTIGSQTVKAAMLNPIENLRED